MGLNFFLLSYGVAWMLGPLAAKGRIKGGHRSIGAQDNSFFGIVNDAVFSIQSGCDFVCHRFLDLDLGNPFGVRA